MQPPKKHRDNMIATVIMLKLSVGSEKAVIVRLTVILTIYLAQIE